VPDAFSSLGVCAELWQTEFLKSNGDTQAELTVAVINDLDSSFSDYFIVHILKGESVVSSTQYRYDVKPFAINRTPVKLNFQMWQAIMR
jgi:hypothetical protein